MQGGYALWREAFAYILCEGPAGPSRNIPLKAILDENRDVAAQVARSLLSQEALGDDHWIPLDSKTRKIVVELASDDLNTLQSTNKDCNKCLIGRFDLR